MTARRIVASVCVWPGHRALVQSTFPMEADNVAPVHNAIRQCWEDLPPVLAQARPEDRFQFLLEFVNHEGQPCPLYTAQGLSAGTLVRTIATKLVRQVRALEGRHTPTVTELHGAAADRVMADLATLRATPPGVIPWVDPFEGVRS